MSSTISALLIYPPLADPTSPYHSLVYLASAARAHGHRNVRLVDANIESVHYLARREVMDEKLDRWSIERTLLRRKRSITAAEQLRYLHLVGARNLEPSAASNAISVLQGSQAFYDYERYAVAARTLKLWLRCLSIDAFPGQFDSRMQLSNESLFSLSSVRDLTSFDTVSTIVGPYAEYFEHELLPEVSSAAPDLVGISVTYTSQLPYALWLAKRLREELGAAYIVSGGTEVSGVWKYASSPETFRKVFVDFDACVLGEGESAFVRILDSLAAGRRPGAEAPNICYPRCSNGKSVDRPILPFYEDLCSLATPDYSLMDTGRYLAPEPVLYYSPTRGCYWNKCTFCDYGLNYNSPTSPWRQRSLSQVVSDLAAARKIAKYVYLSVDVLAPGALVRLAQMIAEAGLDIRWAAELRIEKFFTRDRCATLRESGCVAVSVGFESGCQRILNAINKGIDLEGITQTIRHFYDAGIAVQMMGFTGFPTETLAEAHQSVEFLRKWSRYWTVAGLGEFLLTPGAIIAQNPGKFGIRAARALSGADVVRFLAFDLDIPIACDVDRQSSELETAKASLVTAEFDRPFAGGIDSAHSLLYYGKYGLGFPRDMRNSVREVCSADSGRLMLNGVLALDEPFDLMTALDLTDLTELHAASRRSGVLLDREGIEKALASKPAIGRSGSNLAFAIRTDGAVVPCSSELVELLERATGSYDLDELIAMIGDRALDRRETYRLLERYAALLGLVHCDRARVPDEASGFLREREYNR